ncbi:two-component regulator propeller domain-containing protein [Chryseolinea sp. T2]|uniref:hybrid sensor histidine kinase/response regulator transcription factor n=1 Tax=Chryseolinea sp. T2 TaxID=3129255 RepID=UPI00307697BE
MIRVSKLVWCVCLGIVTGNIGFAQFQPNPLIKHYSIRDGLSQGVVNSIVEDADNMIWIATEDGLNRFDGYNFKVFKQDQGDGKVNSDNFIQSLFRDSNDTLWISSRNGLLSFDPGRESFKRFRYTGKSAINDVSFITEGASKNLWVAWYAEGLASFNKTTKQFTPYVASASSLSSSHTVAIHEDKLGFLWIGTQNGGLNVYKVSNGQLGERIGMLSDQEQLPSANVRTIVEDRFTNVWIGTSKGITVYLRQQNKFYTFDDPRFEVSGKGIFALLVDSNDNLWIGTQGSGLYQLDLRQFNTRQPNDFIFTRHTHLADYDISKRTIQCFYEDKNKNLWLGTFGDGLYMISHDKEKFARVQTPLYNQSAMSLVSYYGICYDHDGNLWLGTDGNGLIVKEQSGKDRRHFIADGEPGSLEDNAIQAALCDSKGRLWFGTYSHGLYRYDKQRDAFVHYAFKGTDAVRSGGYDIRAIFEDSKHRLWIGTNRGGICLVDEQSQSYATPAGLPDLLYSGDIRTIIEDKGGSLWLGFYGDGVHRFEPASGKLEHYFGEEDPRGQLNNRIVYSLALDRQNNLWVGTAGGGLYQYDPKRKNLRNYTERDGLINNTIYAILIDNNNQCWVSTNTGVSRFNPGSRRFTNYQAIDGLQEGQFNPGSGLYNYIAGYMCFGGTQGLNVFHPEQMEEHVNKPVVMITGLQLFNRPVSLGDRASGKPILTKVISKTDEITLSHDQSVITLEFVGLDYSHTERMKYAYQLEALDDDWNYVGNQRTATYRYLKPGKYVFKVKASNESDRWSDEYARLTVVIEPPFWSTPWAYALYFATAMLLGILIYRVSRRQISLRKRLKIEKAQRKHDRRMAMEKLTFFTEISHEFRTPLTLIIGPLEELLSRESLNSPHVRKLRMVHRNAHKLLELINKLLDYRKIESGSVMLKVREDDVVSFTGEIFSMFNDLAEKKNVRYTFHAEQEEVRVWFDRERLEMVISNIISNAFKYIGEGTEITVTVGSHFSDKYPQGRIVIKVRDNGMGISKKHMSSIFEWFYKGDNSVAMSSGIGLSLARKLVHLHKGDIYVESTEGQGSTFSIKIPLGKAHFNEGEVTFVTSEPEDNPVATVVNGHDDMGELADGAPHRKNENVVLIIEDDEEIRGFIKEYVSDTYSVLEAENGTEGLEIAQTQHPDLIISDIMMPGIEGIEVCRQLKQNVRTSHIPVILLTARTSLQHQKEGIEIGADAYMTKPFSPEILSLTISNLLKSRTSLMRFYRNLFMETSQPEPEQERNAMDEKFLHSIYDQLKANLSKTDFNINELADVLNMSRSLVYKKVKMLTGLSPVEYVRSLRMQEAAKLLRTHQYKVFEVVYMVGFSDLKYFRKCFAKEFGVSPSDYIRQVESQNP